MLFENILKKKIEKIKKSGKPDKKRMK